MGSDWQQRSIWAASCAPQTFQRSRCNADDPTMIVSIQREAQSDLVQIAFQSFPCHNQKMMPRSRRFAPILYAPNTRLAVSA
jgi:hypothetical protein